MDDSSRKRAAGGLGFSRRGSNLSFREPNREERSTQYCNRLGCSSRRNSMKGTEIGSTPEKSKYPRSVRSMSGKSIGESFYRPTVRDIGENSNSRQRVAEETETSSQLKETVGSEFGIQTELTDSENSELPTSQRSPALSAEHGRRPCKQISRRAGSNSQDIASSSSSIRRPTGFKSSSQFTHRYGLKNISCTSITDFLPSGCSSFDNGQRRRVSSVRKRPSDGESSSSAGKTSTQSSSIISMASESYVPQPAPGRAKSRPLSRDGPVSVRTRRAPGVESRMRLPEQRNEHIQFVSEPGVYSQLPRNQLTIPEVVHESPSRSFTIEAPPIFPSSFGERPNSSGRSTRSRLVSSRLEDNSTHDGYQRFNMEGIAEVLLALERIEQDDELTYEQLLALETNLLLGGFSFQDRHRDLRLDIDNMTYEELLALEEKMGNVSTALSEEALTKCVKRSSFVPATKKPAIGACEDDVQCSICQEEYATGDEVGKLACDHRYHVDCIYQWLRLKNWCPICKKSASLGTGQTKD